MSARTSLIAVAKGTVTDSTEARTLVIEPVVSVCRCALFEGRINVKGKVAPVLN
jgi:hypothetical protein